MFEYLPTVYNVPGFGLPEHAPSSSWHAERNRLVFDTSLQGHSILSIRRSVTSYLGAKSEFRFKLHVEVIQHYHHQQQYVFKSGYGVSLCNWTDPYMLPKVAVMLLFSPFGHISRPFLSKGARLAALGQAIPYIHM